MKAAYLVFFGLLIFSPFRLSAIQIGGFEYSEKEIAEIHQALEQWNAFAESCIQNPATENIQKLGFGLRKTNLPSVYVVGDRIAANKRLQTALLQIPGHAEYYEHRIKAAQDKYFNATEASVRGLAGAELANEITDGFKTLGQLPSPETLGVLGEFLYDFKGTDEKGQRLPEFVRGTAPVCTRAAQALNDLPLKSRPMPYQRFIYSENVKTWQLWYQQIKAGNRTFSFEGDPNEYDLNGIAREARNPDIPRVIKRPRSQEGSLPESDKSSSVPTSWIAGTVAVFVALCGWLALRKKRSV